MATDVLQPLLDSVNSKLNLVDKEKALHMFKSIYGENYQNQSDFRSAIGLLANENKISIGNTLLLEEGLTENSQSKKLLKDVIREFKVKNREEISDFSEKASKDFVGRDVKKLEMKINEYPGIILYGASGVGKTKFARKFLSTWSGESKKIDLRGLDTIELVCVETLKCLGKPVNINIDEASINMVCHVVSKYPNRNTILLFDNADDFIRYPGKGMNVTDRFSSLLEGILQNSNGKMKIIATSREKSLHSLANEYLYQEELKSLDNNAANSMIEKYMIHEKEHADAIKKATIYCQNLPLNLKILGAALQDVGVSLGNILPFVKEKAKEWKELHEKATETEQFTYGVISVRFDKLSDTIQQSAVALSLFTRSFSFNTVEKIFRSFSKQRLLMILESLRHVNFLSLESDNEHDIGKMVYDMHPRVKEFLTEKTHLKHVDKFYKETREHFLSYYKDYLFSVSHLIESDYLEGYRKYQEELSNLEFFINNCKGELLFHEKYDDLQLVGPFLLCMLNPNVRLMFFKTLAKDLLQKGAKLLGIQLLCHAALCEGFYNPVNAVHSTLLKIEHFLRREQMQNSKADEKNDFKVVESLYYYTKGQLLYQKTHSNHNMNDCDESLAAFKLSVMMQEAQYPNGHNDLVRSYLNLGNGYNMKKDLYDKSRPERKENVDLALIYYQKSLEMKKKLSDSELHFDIPQIYENIGTIHHQNENYKEAKSCFEKALNIEKELQLDGQFNTTTKLVNLGALHQRLKQYDQAFICYNEAYNIRKALKGTHKDTVLTIYRMAESKRLSRKFSEAVNYYIEAFEMEETLPANYHSSVWKLFPNKIITTMQKSLGYEERNQEEWTNYQYYMISWEEKLKKLEEKARELASSLMELADTPTSQAITAMKSLALMEQDVEMFEEHESLDFYKSIHYWFDERGGFVDFRYLGVYITIPSHVTSQSSLIKVERIAPNNINMKLSLGEYLISDVINIKAENYQSSIALLEMPCNVTDSSISKYSQIVMMTFDAIENRWNQVENSDVFIEDYDCVGAVTKFPVVYGLISSFSKYAVISRPILHEYIIGKDGKTCRPYGNDDIAFEFPSDAFIDSECKCAIKVVMPSVGHFKGAESPISVVCPIFSVETSSKTLKKSVTIKLPLIWKPLTNGDLLILKNDSELLDNWNDVTGFVKCKLKENVLELKVTSFSWYMILWLKNASLKTTNTVKTAIFNAFSNSYDAAFHLYKGINEDKSCFPIALSCIPFSSNHDEQFDLRMRPERDGRYFYIDSQPSNDKIIDSELALVSVEGQYENLTEDKHKKRLRLCRKMAMPTRFRVKVNQYKDTGGDVEIIRESSNEILCNIAYYDDFKSSKNNKFDETERRRSSPFRFLGLRLDRCALEDVSIVVSDFRNRLYKTAIHETFIDEIKHASEHESQQMITKHFLNHITHKFRRDELAEDWFHVFQEHLWPPHARVNLTKVMDYLQTPLDGEKQRIISESILEDEDLQCLVRNFAETFTKKKIKHPSCHGLISDGRQLATNICNDILMEYYSNKNQNKNLLKIIKDLLSIEEYPISIQRILDNIGLKIEDQVLPCR